MLGLTLWVQCFRALLTPICCLTNTPPRFCAEASPQALTRELRVRLMSPLGGAVAWNTPE